MAFDQSYIERVRAALADRLPQLVPAADAARRDGLGTATLLHAAHATALRVEHARVAAKFGAASAELGAVEARQRDLATAAAAARQLRERASVQEPDVPEGSAAVFGRVADRAGHAIAHAVVDAIDARGVSHRQVTTEADGRYELVLLIDAAEKQYRPVQDGGSALIVHLRVGIDGRPVLTDKEPITLQPGDRVLRDLTVTAPNDARRTD